MWVGSVCVCMCVCWEGHGRVFPLDHLLPNPTNLPSISVPSRKKSGTSFPAMSLDLWLCDNEIETIIAQNPEC